MSPCEGKSQHQCSDCGKCVGLFTVCGCGVDLPINSGYDDDIVSTYGLKELYDELGSMLWTGNGIKCSNTVESIRAIIKDYI